MPLTPKQERFCQEYIKTGNKSEAYRLAYDAENMSAETVNVKANELSNNGKITVRIEELQNEAKKRNDVDIDWCIEKLKAIIEESDKDRVPALDKLIKTMGGYSADNKQKEVQITNVINLGEGTNPAKE